MGSLPQLSVMYGERRHVDAAPIATHFDRLADCHETALIYEDSTCTARVSFWSLHTRANSLARAIVARSSGLPANVDGDYAVAVCMPPTHDTVIALLSIWKAGACYVPLDPSFPQARLLHVLRDSRPVLLIHDHTVDPSQFAESGVRCASYSSLSREARALPGGPLAAAARLAAPTAAAAAALLYTSGSTGTPKGVRITYDAMCNRLWWQFDRFPYSPSERRCVWKTALTFVDSIAEMWGPLLNGRTLVVLPKEVTRDPQRLVNALADNEVERLVLVPTLLRSILMYLSLNPSERPLKSLKLWVCSGETLTKELAGEFFAYFGDGDGHKLANFYGSTEVMGDVTYYVIESKAQLDAHSTVPIGVPVYNSCVLVLEGAEGAEGEQGARGAQGVAGAGAPGELWVAGRALAAGYVGGRGDRDAFRDNPHATHHEFSRMYRTGDHARVHKGVLQYRGRRDQQLKVRGHRVHLAEVEAAVGALPHADKVVVLGYGAESANPSILSFVTLKEGARVSAHQLEAALRDVLTDYMIPQVIIVESIPLLVNGKVDRQALLKMYENTNNNEDPAVSLDIEWSGSEGREGREGRKGREGWEGRERVLLECVGAALGRAARGTLSLRASFFQLGGNSLNSIYTITRLREQGYYIQISDFLSAPTLGEVAARMSRSPGAGAGEWEGEWEGERGERGEEVGRFVSRPLRDEHRPRVVEMVVSSFYEKAELERFVRSQIEREDYAACVSACWGALLQADLSIVLLDESETPVAVALNFDARDEPEVELKGGLAKIMAFLEYVEGPVRDTLLPQGKGTVLHSFMMATAAELSASENVSAIAALEEETLKRARQRGFRGVFTTNTSPLTQQLGTDVLGFQTLLDYQINQYVDSNNEAVFGAATDDMRAIVCWKPID